MFELWLTRAAFEDDPKRDLVPLICVVRPTRIEALAPRLGRDEDAVYFCAQRNSAGAGAVPEYPADETDEG